MMIEKVATFVGNTDTSISILAILVLLGLIAGLAAALIIYYADIWQDRKRRCAWCHSVPEHLSSSICHKHARMIRRQSAQRQARKRSNAKLSCGVVLDP